MAAHALPPRICDLRSLHDALSEQGATAMSGDYRELFGLTDRMLKIDDTMLLAFRHDDIRRLSGIRAVSNVPIEPYMDMSYHLPPDEALREDEQVNIRQFHRNQFFTALPPAHAVLKPMFAKAMSPIVVKSLRPLAAEVAQRLIDGIGSRVIDFHHEFAEPFALAFWAEVFEMTAEEVRVISQASPTLLPIATGEYARADLIAMNAAIPDYFAPLASAIARLEAKGGHVFVDDMVKRFAQRPGVSNLFFKQPLSDRRIYVTCTCVSGSLVISVLSRICDCP